MFVKTFAVKHMNIIVRSESRSGGFFTALSDAILDIDGVVYGCVLDDELRVKHIRTDNKVDRDRMRKSKYVQSNLMNIFSQVREDLKEGKYVLFSGTPCQIDGLQSFLRKEYERLICLDIVCHGVPSPLIWEDYKNWIEKTKQDNIQEIEFRNKKKFGWKAHVESIELKSGKKIDSEVYKKLFYCHLTLRPSCYDCPYKKIHRYSDISIADFWGIDTALPGFNDDKGVSLVLVNTPKGEDWFSKCEKDIIFCETDIEKCLQPPLVKGFSESPKRAIFWRDYLNMSFDEIVQKYVYKSKIHKLKSWLYRNAKKCICIINTVLPNLLKLTKSK